MPSLDANDWFAPRHIGPTPGERDAMLEAIGAPSLDVLMDEALPAAIRLTHPINLPPAESEHQYLRRLTRIARKNKTFRSYIGLGYHDTVTPSVILRMIMENPGWYTPYTPYQAEIAQGRLESLLNFQTMVTDLTGMDVANASLLDEATAAAEAMTLMHRVRPDAARSGTGSERRVFFVSDRCFPQTIDVVRGRAEPLDIDVHVLPMSAMVFDGETKPFGVLLQYPDECGCVEDLSSVIERAHTAGALVAVGTDLLALALLKPPGEMGADVVFGNCSALASRLAMAVRTQPFSAPDTHSSVRCRDALSASPSMPTDGGLTGWRWPRANSTFGVKRPPRISARRRRCWPTWPRCTACTTVLTACG